MSSFRLKSWVVSFFYIACQLMLQTGCKNNRLNADNDASIPPKNRAAPSSPQADSTAPIATHQVKESTTPQSGSRVYAVDDGQARPGIVMLHGSEGGSERAIDEFARDLANRGFAVMVFCYFGCPGLSNKLEGISLESTVAAIQWFKTSKFVQNQNIGLHGHSRGAEHALLLSSLLKNNTLVKAMSAASGTDYVALPFDPASQGGSTPQLQSTAYLWQNAQVPAGTFWAEFESAQENSGSGQWLLDPQSDSYSLAGRQPTARDFEQMDAYPFCLPAGVEHPFNAGVSESQRLIPGIDGEVGRIRVEDYQGAMLIMHGVQDGLWPVEFSRRMEASRRKTPTLKTQSLYLDDCHGFTSEESYRAIIEKMKTFFSEELGQPQSTR